MTNKSGDDNHPQERHPYRFFWLTGGLATIVAAVIGVSIVLSSTGSASKSGPQFTESPAVSPSAPPAIPSDTPQPSAGSSGGSTTPAIRHQGPATLKDGANGANLDSRASNWDIPRIGYDSDVSLAGLTNDVGEAIISNIGKIVKLDGLSPDYQGCSSATDTVQYIQVSTLSVGFYFCVLTDLGRWSLVQVTEISSDELTVSVVATTWESTGNS